MANKLGISLEDTSNAQDKEVEVKPAAEIINKPAEKAVKLQPKPYTPRNNEPKVIPKKNYNVPKVQDRKSSR
jgi:hypothetical protein